MFVKSAELNRPLGSAVSLPKSRSRGSANSHPPEAWQALGRCIEDDSPLAKREGVGRSGEYGRGGAKGLEYGSGQRGEEGDGEDGMVSFSVSMGADVQGTCRRGAEKGLETCSYHPSVRSQSTGDGPQP
jgi:hypothetical protein